MDSHSIPPDPEPGGTADSTGSRPHVWRYWWPWATSLTGKPTSTTNPVGSRARAVSTST